jgi:hypothetical protein
MKHRRRKNFLRALILGFATAAIVVSGAQASYHTQKAQDARTALNNTYTPEALKALTLRSEAMNQRYQSIGDEQGLEIRSEAMNKLHQAASLAVVRPDDRSGVRGVQPQTTGYATDLTEVQRQVEADRIAALIGAESKRPDDKAGFHGPGPVETRTATAVTVDGNGFDWTDVGIGAGVMVGIVLILMSGLALSRRRSGLAV